MGAAGGEKQIDLGPRQRLLQRQRERDGEERVSPPVGGGDREDSRQPLRIGRAAFETDYAAGDSREDRRQRAWRGVEARIGHATTASQASGPRSTSRSRRHLWWPSGQ